MTGRTQNAGLPSAGTPRDPVTAGGRKKDARVVDVGVDPVTDRRLIRAVAYAARAVHAAG
jgi:hypothetical protein